MLAGQLGFYGTLGVDLKSTFPSFTVLFFPICPGDNVPGPLARFRLPRALALDELGQRHFGSVSLAPGSFVASCSCCFGRLFVSDAANHAVRTVSLLEGTELE